jgi:hypothetical protein
VVWLGTHGYLLNQSVLFCSATPFNNLFVVYVTYLGLAVWSIVLLLRGTTFDACGPRKSSRTPIRLPS